MATPSRVDPLPAEQPRLRTRARAVALGSERRIGLWILPLFLISGLLGATLAGALAVLYFGQQVDRLEATTAGARAEVAAAGEELTRTAEDARAAIDEQVTEVERRLAVTYPVGLPADGGVYAASAHHARGEIRVGTAFTVFSDEGETYFLVNYRLIAAADGLALPVADILLPGQRLTLRVHSYDRDLDLAVLVATGGPLPVLPWRPRSEPIERGAAVYVVGVAGADTAAIVEGRVGGVSRRAVLPVLPLNAAIAGGPIVDSAGRVVAVSSLDYRPFGDDTGGLHHAVPIHRLCERLLRCTRSDLEVGELGAEGEASGAARPRGAEPEDVPADRPRSPEPLPSPSPTPTPTPTQRATPQPEAEPDDEPVPPPRPSP